MWWGELCLILKISQTNSSYDSLVRSVLSHPHLVNTVRSLSGCHEMTHISLQKTNYCLRSSPTQTLKSNPQECALSLVSVTSRSYPTIPESRITDRNNSFQAYTPRQQWYPKFQSSLKSVNSIVFVTPQTQEVSRERVWPRLAHRDSVLHSPHKSECMNIQPKRKFVLLCAFSVN